MKVLLDENFPLSLESRLRARGWEAQHIISLGQRGLPDAVIRQRLKVEALVFLTQDLEFLVPPAECKAAIVVSRVPQSLPIHRRIDIWEQALVGLAATPLVAAVFELFESGGVVRVG